MSDISSDDIEAVNALLSFEKGEQSSTKRFVNDFVEYTGKPDIHLYVGTDRSIDGP